jgi:hypothetical protein
MIYDGNLIKINDTVIPAIVNYKVGRNKLWKNADRNMAGEVRAVLIGIYPKIELNIGITNQEQMATLTELLDADFFEVEYFDVRVQGTITASYYAGDYATEIQDKRRGLYKPFTVSLVPVSKRRY